jgi:hypothetical protein
MIELDKYKDVYHRFVVMLTDLHNANVHYTKGPSVRNGITLRRILRELRILEKEMWIASQKASKEASKANGRGRPKKER